MRAHDRYHDADMRAGAARGHMHPSNTCAIGYWADLRNSHPGRTNRPAAPGPGSERGPLRALRPSYRPRGYVAHDDDKGHAKSASCVQGPLFADLRMHAMKCYVLVASTIRRNGSCQGRCMRSQQISNTKDSRTAASCRRQLEKIILCFLRR